MHCSYIHDVYLSWNFLYISHLTKTGAILCMLVVYSLRLYTLTVLCCFESVTRAEFAASTTVDCLPIEADRSGALPINVLAAIPY